jgi:hypothetical protein
MRAACKSDRDESAACAAWAAGSPLPAELCRRGFVLGVRASSPHEARLNETVLARSAWLF